jgi:hypothetical protein
MAAPNMLPHHRFRVRRSANANGDGPYAFLCVVTSKSISLSNNYSDAMLPNCSDADELPQRKSVKTGTMWGASFSGIVDPAHLEVLRTDIRREVPTWYEFEIDPEDGVAAGVFRGALHLESLEITGGDNGHVTFSVTARGEAEPSWVPA